MNPPFVQRKFRVKVSQDTPTDEIQSYKDESIQRARMETTRLKIRMKRWEKDLAELQQKIDLTFEDPNMKEEEILKFEQILKKDEEVNARKTQKAFRRVQITCENELNAGGTQFLLKFIKDKPLTPGGWGYDQRSTLKKRFRPNRHWEDPT